MTVDEILRRAADDLVADVQATTDAPAALDRVRAPRSAPHRWLPVAAALVVVLGLVALAAAVWSPDGQNVKSGPSFDARPSTPGPATGESAGLPMTVDPAAGLEDGDRVRVTAEGLPPGEVTGFVLCPTDALVTGDGEGACQVTPAEDVVVDEAGHVEGRFVVERLLTVGDTREHVDCARDVRCAVGVAVQLPLEQPDGSVAYRYELRGLVAIELAPQEALLDPTVSVTPTAGLRHGDTVTVAGEHFSGSVGTGMICSPEPDGDCAFVDLGDIPVGDAGSFEVEVPMWRAFPALGLDRGGEIVDCVEVACTLEVIGQDGRTSNAVALDFDPDAPLPQALTVSVTPTTGIRPGDPLTVTVTGLEPGDEVYATLCGTDASVTGGCQVSSSFGTVMADAGGRAVATLAVGDPAEIGVDCTQAGLCAISLGDTDRFGYDPMIRTTVPVPVRFSPP
jgi:hypothetical protein